MEQHANTVSLSPARFAESLTEAATTVATASASESVSCSVSDLHVESRSVRTDDVAVSHTIGALPKKYSAEALFGTFPDIRFNKR